MTLDLPLVLARHTSRPHFSSYIIGISLLIILISGFGIMDMAATSITGFASATQSTKSNVTISGYLAIALSNNLSADGISFGTITLLPANNTNATLNFVNTSSGLPAGSDQNTTLYNVTVSSDSNQAADFCLKANAGLETSGGAAVIGLGNMTWADNKTANNKTSPGGPYDMKYPPTVFGRRFTTAYVKGELSVSVGSADHYRFWLNVSAAQGAGDYNNTVSFRGVTTGDVCGS